MTSSRPEPQADFARPYYASKCRVPRRAFLRAAGVTLALPWLDAMCLAFVTRAQAANAAALETDAERNEFTSDLHQRVRNAYQVRADGKVLFPFRRTFVIAYR